MNLEEMLAKDGDEWVLKSKDGTRILRRFGKEKPSEEEVGEAERQVHAAKAAKESEDAETEEAFMEQLSLDEFEPKDSASEWVRLEESAESSDEVEPTGKPSHAIIGEHAPTVLQLSEEELSEGVAADIILLEPGMGNKRDNHWYGPEVLRKTAHKFEGTKMYATNHNPGEHNVRNWVATITEAGKRFTPSGAPIARVLAHKNWFAKDLKELEKNGLLHAMHNSILATGKARVGRVNGQPANIVEDITDVKSVDFVSKAGAGGHVVALIEAAVEGGDLELLTFDMLAKRRPDLVEGIRIEEKEKLYDKIETSEALTVTISEKEQELEAMAEKHEELEARIVELEEEGAEKDVLLAEQSQSSMKQEAIRHLLEVAEEKKLPKITVERLTTEIEEGLFEEDADTKVIVDALVKSEEEYLKALAKGGKVMGLGETYQEDPEETKPDTRSLEERQADTDAVLAKYGVPVMAGAEE